MTLYACAIQPFVEYGFMRRALAACAALAIGGAPLGVFLVLRRMALIGDALSHAVLPGVAIAYLCFGLSLPAMTAGGLLAGLLVVLAAGAVTRLTPLKEDMSLTASYLLSLAAGVLIMSAHGNDGDALVHTLFGDAEQVSVSSLLIAASSATVSVMALACIYRSLVVECFDPGFLRVAGGDAWTQYIFLALAALNLVAGFQALGTLMALGVMVLPAIAAHFWSRTIDGMIFCAVGFGLGASYLGLLFSYHYGVPSGPAIVLTAGAFYAVSIAFGSCGGIAARYFPRRHYAK